jgi:hypothetical protein
MRHHVVAGAGCAGYRTGRAVGLGARGVRPTHLDAHSHTKFCVSTLLADQVIEQAASFPLLARN